MTDPIATWFGAIVMGMRSAGIPELLAVACGLAYIGLAIRQHRACWIVGGVSTALYIAVFLEAGLPLQAALQAVYVVLSVYGWLAWKPGRDTGQRPRHWSLRGHLLGILGVLLMTAISTPLLARYTAAEAPLADSVGVWASLVATWLLARRYLDTWFWWVILDAGLATLFTSQGLAFTAALYLAYSLLAIAGWRAWKLAMAEDSG